MIDQDRFMLAVRNLHRQKSTAYGPAWKRRGELISIMANLARKADRIESAMSGANASQDETIIDTAVDLFVYTIKYMTFLADQDPAVAASLFPAQAATSGFSDGTNGFDHLLATALAPDSADGPSLDTQHAAASVLSEFAQLEQCFDNTGPTCPPTVRTMRAEALRAATQQLISAHRREAPGSFEAFLLTWSAEDSEASASAADDR